MGVVVALPLLGWWLFGPAALASVANRRLPHRVDRDLVITRAHPSPPTAPAALTVEMSAGRMRDLARAAGQSIPPMLLREGMTVEARWSGLEGSDPLALRAQVATAGDPPLARARLSAALVNALIERHHRDEQAGSRVTWDYRLDPGSVVVDEGAPVAVGDGWRRRFRATASGEVEASLGGDRCLVRVTYLEATVDLDLLRDGDAWRLRGDVGIVRCESTIVECRSALLRLAAGGLPRLLETLLDQALSEESLEDARLPGLFPTDLRLDGRLE